MEKQPSLRERIALGECVSEQGTDRCPVCVDSCEVFRHKCNLKDLKDSVGIVSNEFKDDK